MVQSRAFAPTGSFIGDPRWFPMALDVPGRNMSLLEPTILVSVALARREADRQRRGDISWLSDVAQFQQGAGILPLPRALATKAHRQ